MSYELQGFFITIVEYLTILSYIFLTLIFLKYKKMNRDFAKKHDLFYFETTPTTAYVHIDNALKSIEAFIA